MSGAIWSLGHGNVSIVRGAVVGTWKVTLHDLHGQRRSEIANCGLVFS